jgi:hypothetical protein
MLAQDGRTFLIGLVAAAGAGLLMGAGLKPDLDGDHEARAPQILVPHAGLRTVAERPEPTVAAYGADVPVYVFGTDALPRPDPAPQIVEASVDETDPADNPLMVYEAPDPPRIHARLETSPRPAPSYPSLDGNISASREADAGAGMIVVSAPAA